MSPPHHHHGHVHDPAPAQRRALGLALAANAGYTLVQVVAGIVAGSVALIADAGHNLSDVLALAIALGAAALARRPGGSRQTFGYRRAEILAALVNAVSIVAVGAIVAVEALRRLSDPPEVPGGLLIVVAAGGIVVNLWSAWLIHRADRGHGDLNMRASFLHLAGDAAASAGVMVAGLLVLLFDWRLADPVIALVIAALIVVSAWGVLRDAVLVLLESAPRGLDPDEVGRAMATHAGVSEVHDLHVWSVASDFPALAAHVVVDEGRDCHAVRRELAAMLEERFGISHSTLQTDHRPRRVIPVGGAPGCTE